MGCFRGRSADHDRYAEEGAAGVLSCALQGWKGSPPVPRGLEVERAGRRVLSLRTELGLRGRISGLSCVAVCAYYSSNPQTRESANARSRSASSPTTQPMKDRPIGQPDTVPAGMLTCGNPVRP